MKSYIKMISAPAWEDLTEGPQSIESQLLIQAVALLTSHPSYEHMTPWEVYDAVVSAWKVT